MLLHPFLCLLDSHPHNNCCPHLFTLHLESWPLATPTTHTLLELHFPLYTPTHRWNDLLFFSNFYIYLHRLVWWDSVFCSGSVTGVWWSDVFWHRTAAGSTQTFSTTPHFTTSHSQTSPTRGESDANPQRISPLKIELRLMLNPGHQWHLTVYWWFSIV